MTTSIVVIFPSAFLKCALWVLKCAIWVLKCANHEVSCIYHSLCNDHNLEEVPYIKGEFKLYSSGVYKYSVETKILAEKYVLLRRLTFWQGIKGRRLYCMKGTCDCLKKAGLVSVGSMLRIFHSYLKICSNEGYLYKCLCQTMTMHCIDQEALLVPKHLVTMLQTSGREFVERQVYFDVVGENCKEVCK